MSWFYGLTFNDPFSGVSTRSYELVAADFAAARLIADTVLLASTNLSTAGIVEERLTEKITLAGVAGGTSNVDEGLTFQFDLGGPKRASINFPSPVLTVVNSDRSVDLDNALVIAWTAPFLAGDILISDGEVVADIIKGQLDR